MSVSGMPEGIPFKDPELYHVDEMLKILGVKDEISMVSYE